MKNDLIIPFCLTILLFTASCVPPIHPAPVDNSTFNSKKGNALQVGEALPYFTTYTFTLERLNLADIMTKPGPYTFFIPNSQAFKVFLEEGMVNSLEDIPDDSLGQILLNHIIHGSYLEMDLKDGYYQTLAVEKTTRNPLVMYIQNDGLFEINGVPCMGTPDVGVDNGMIQNLTQVIKLPTVFDHLYNNKDFSDFIQIISRNDLGRDYYSILMKSSPKTVIAPTNNAFENYMASQPDWDNVDKIPADTLKKILDSYIIPGKNIVLKNLADESTGASLNGTKITFIADWIYRSVEIGNSASLKLNVMDIQATNGIVQQIDRIVLP